VNVVGNGDDESPASAIRLDDFLKRQGLVATGGEAKVRIQAGEVMLNNQVETRRRKQLYEGDCVEFEGEIYQVNLDDL
jgi:ribosome-associated protein